MRFRLFFNRIRIVKFKKKIFYIIKCSPYFLKLKKQKIVFTAIAYSHPPQRGFTNTNGIELLSPEHRFARTQDLPKVFHDAGAAYIFNDKLFGRSPFGPDGAIYELEPRYAQDIDEEADWEMAELKYDKNAV